MDDTGDGEEARFGDLMYRLDAAVPDLPGDTHEPADANALPFMLLRCCCCCCCCCAAAWPAYRVGEQRVPPGPAVALIAVIARGWYLCTVPGDAGEPS